MKNNYGKLLKSLIDDLNAKSDDEIFDELLSAKVVFDDISDMSMLTSVTRNVMLSGSSSYVYNIKSVDLLCA